LEWATASPSPEYNFARIPEVSTRDAFWEAKRKKQPIAIGPYSAIELPKNSAGGIMIAAAAFIAGFAIIWHIWWLAALGAIGVIASVIVRSTFTETERVISAKHLQKTEEGAVV
jgi:cytochrome o ubiquinol oxidase subunit 1